MTTEIPVSPTKSHKPVTSTKVVSLDSPIRQVAIHSDLPEIKVPTGDLKPFQYHPVSCEPLSSEDLQNHKLPQLQKQYTTPEAALKAQAEATKEVKDRMAQAEKKTREIERKMEEMEKTREIERKIYMKQGKTLPEAV
jgi:septal ring factor EnvC (AmiA/AmiB activator)